MARFPSCLALFALLHAHSFAQIDISGSILNFTASPLQMANDVATAMYSGCLETLPNGTQVNGSGCVVDLARLGLKSVSEGLLGEHVVTEGVYGQDSFQGYYNATLQARRAAPNRRALPFKLESHRQMLHVTSPSQDSRRARRSSQTSRSFMKVNVRENLRDLSPILNATVAKRQGPLPLGGAQFSFQGFFGLKWQARALNITIAPQIVADLDRFGLQWVTASAMSLRESNVWSFKICYIGGGLAVDGNVVVEADPFGTNFETGLGNPQTTEHSTDPDFATVTTTSFTTITGTESSMSTIFTTNGQARSDVATSVGEGCTAAGAVLR